MSFFNQSCFRSFEVASSGWTLGRNSSLGGEAVAAPSLELSQASLEQPGIVEKHHRWDWMNFSAPSKPGIQRIQIQKFPVRRDLARQDLLRSFSNPAVVSVTTSVCGCCTSQPSAALGSSFTAWDVGKKKHPGAWWECLEILGAVLWNLCTAASPSSHHCKSLISPLFELSSCNFIILKQAKAVFSPLF